MSSSNRKQTSSKRVLRSKSLPLSKRLRALDSDDDDDDDDDPDTNWNQKFFELMLYRAKHGDVHVQSTDDEHRDLYEWMTQQRKEFKRYSKNAEASLLNEDRIQVLSSVGFSFQDRKDENWFHQYNQLKNFHQKYGHVLVQRNSEFKGLGDWVVAQRTQHGLMLAGKESHMTPRRKALLDEIGFVWQIRKRPGWEARYEELVEFKSKHGHTKVPQNYPENKALGKWVALQRTEYTQLKDGKKSSLTRDRLEKLNAINFVWYAKERSEDFDFVCDSLTGASC